MSRYDVYIQVVPAAQQTGFKFLSFGPTRTLGVRGIQKLLNIFTIELLTPVGTDPLDLERGTDIPNLLESNISVNDAKDILVLGVNRTVQHILGYQDGQPMDNDERLAGASVTQFISIIDPPGFSAQIFITNILDARLSFLLPTLQIAQN